MDDELRLVAERAPGEGDLSSQIELLCVCFEKFEQEIFPDIEISLEPRLEEGDPLLGTGADDLLEYRLLPLDFLMEQGKSP